MATDVSDVHVAAPARRRPLQDHRFFLTIAIVVTVINVAAFSMQAALGRSNFAQPWHVHLHAIVFFGWVMLYLCQNVLVATGALRWHRTLGWVAVGWMAGMGHMAKRPFVLAGLLGRGLRFGLEAVLIGLYGAKALDVIMWFLDNEILLAVVCIAAIGVLYVLWRWWSKIGPSTPPADA